MGSSGRTPPQRPPNRTPRSPDAQRPERKAPWSSVCQPGALGAGVPLGLQCRGGTTRGSNAVPTAYSTSPAPPACLPGSGVLGPWGDAPRRQFSGVWGRAGGPAVKRCPGPAVPPQPGPMLPHLSSCTVTHHAQGADSAAATVGQSTRRGCSAHQKPPSTATPTPISSSQCQLRGRRHRPLRGTLSGALHQRPPHRVAARVSTGQKTDFQHSPPLSTAPAHPSTDPACGHPGRSGHRPGPPPGLPAW